MRVREAEWEEGHGDRINELRRCRSEVLPAVRTSVRGVFTGAILVCERRWNSEALP